MLGEFDAWLCKEITSQFTSTEAKKRVFGLRRPLLEGLEKLVSLCFLFMKKKQSQRLKEYLILELELIKIITMEQFYNALRPFVERFEGVLGAIKVQQDS